MNYSTQNIILEIHRKEDKISSQSKRLIDEAHEMTMYLQDLLFSVKNSIISEGFKSEDEEVNFFRTIKPHVICPNLGTFKNRVFC